MTRFFKMTTLCLFSGTILSAGAVAAAEADAGPTTVTNAVVSTANAASYVANPAPAPHCEVPCGIYTDQLRFEQMLEDTTTIAKAITSVNEIADGFHNEGPPSAKTINQMTRWINTKESHATNIQHIVAQYFLTQRIKADSDNYAKQLAAAHTVMVSAMKCKQDADAATAKTLKESIYNLYRAYEGKEPQFHEDEKK